VLLFEQTEQLGTQSSARSAAIFRLAVAEPINVRLAVRSLELGRALVPGGVVTQTGGLYPVEDDELRRAILDAAGPAGVRPSTLADVPAPLSHRERPGLYSPLDGSIDTHALLQALVAAARRSGVAFQLGSRVAGLTGNGLILEDGRELPAELVVDATGAWSGRLEGTSDIGVRPARRHLFVLDTPLTRAFPGVVWDLTDGLYLRPESGGLLVSPCDEMPMAPATTVPTAHDAAGLLFSKLERWAPGLTSASVRTFWAGLRPLTSTHRFVVGPDPSNPRLFHVGGFGGHGMTAGVAAGELAAALIDGEEISWARELRPVARA
jgi:D-arginine dehydrogenase